MFNSQYQTSAPLKPSDIANLPKLESLKFLKFNPFLNSSKEVVTSIGKKINKNRFDDLVTNFFINSTLVKLFGKIDVVNSLKYLAKSCPLLSSTMIKNGRASNTYENHPRRVLPSKLGVIEFHLFNSDFSNAALSLSKSY